MHTRKSLSVVAALVVAMVLPSRAGFAQDGFGMVSGPPPTIGYVSGDGSFALKHPQHWQAQETVGRKDFVRFGILGAPDAFVEVRRLSVAEGSRPRQMVLRAREDRLEKMPHFRVDIVRELLVHNAPAASILGSFWYQGNAQFPRTVEELFVVSGTEAFAFHFECFAPMARMIAPELNAFYLSLVPHPAAQPLAPAPEGDAPGEDKWDKVSF